MADQDLEIKVVTTADTAGIQQTREQLEKLRQDAGAKALFAEIPPGGPPKVPPKEAESAGEELAGHIGRGFERMAIHAVGVGAVLEMINAVKAAAEEINKITDALDKQGESLVKNTREMSQQARFAQSDADLQKIAEAGIKAIAEQHKTVEALQKKELSNAEKLADLALKATMAAEGFSLPVGPNQARLDAERKAAEQSETIQRTTAIAALDLAVKEKERLETESYTEAVAELNKQLEEQERKRATAYETGEIQDYLDATKAAQGYKKELLDIIKLEEQRIQAANRAAAPLARALTTPADKFVEEQGRAEYEHQAKRAALEQKRREAVATGDTERSKAIEDELTNDRFSRDQRKEELQRYVANQETLFRQPGETGYDLTRDLGPLGRKKYEAAQAELERIYAEQKAEREKAGGDGKGGGNADVVEAINRLADLWK